MDKNNVKMSLFKPPAAVFGIKEIDPDLFDNKVTVPAFVALPKSIGLLLKKFRPYLLCVEHMKHVIPCPFDTKRKLILLDQDVSFPQSFTEEEQRVLKDESVEVVPHTMTLKYENYSKEDVLKAILPEEFGDITTSFETVGHIAHMNLREREFEYKKVIGQVILDKTPVVKTVVNKTNTIDNTYRHFQMELLAGENEMNATVHEHGCTFEFDFSKVFWNSRLQLEHKRLTDIIKKGDTVYDVFAGVGPFAVPLGKKGCQVYANDLNPYSYEALNGNIKKNKVEKTVKAFNLDGNDFIKMIIAREGNIQTDDMASPFCPESKTKAGRCDSAGKEPGQEGDIHIVMNLPATAIDFLAGFRRKEDNSESLTPVEEKHSSKSHLKQITIHCYCFSKSDKPLPDSRTRVENILNGELDEKSSNFHLVRDVAPKKVMVCATFLLPWDITDCELFRQLLGKDKSSESRGVKRPFDNDDNE